MPDQALRLRLGLFMALALLSALAMAFLFGGTPRLFVSRAKYVVTFPEAPGLSVGTPVRKSGIRIGEVAGMELDEASGLVRVNLLVDPVHSPRPSDDITITRGLLSGDTTLDVVPRVAPFEPGAPKPDPYPPGTEIVGVPPINPRILLNQTAGAIPNAQELLVRITQAFARFEQAAPRAERALDEIAALARAGREAIPELRQTNVKIQELIGTAAPPSMEPLQPSGTQRVSALLQPGAEAGGLAANSPTIRTALQEIIALLRSIRPAADQVRLLVEQTGPEVSDTLRSIQRTSNSVNEVVGPENRKAIAATLRNFQVASDDLTRTIRIAAITLDRVDSTFKQLSARLEQSERIFANVEKTTAPIAANADTIVADVASAVKGANGAIGELSRATTEIRSLVQTVNRSDGSVQRLLNDPTLFTNLNDATHSAAKLILRAEKITADLQVFADKIARRPELLGVGGAVRPSGGLKESPNAPLPSEPLPPILPQQSRVGPLAPASPAGLGPIAPVSVPSYRVPLPSKDQPLLLDPR